MPKKKVVVPAATQKSTFTTENAENLVVDTRVNTQLADQGAAERATPEPTLLQGVGAAYRQESATAAVFDYLGATKHAPDPSFNITKMDWAEITKGIQPQYHGRLLEAVSEEDLKSKIAKIVREQEDQQTVGRLGGTGMLLSMGAAILDPVGIGASVLAAPLGGTAKAGKVASIVRGGAAGATANTLLEAGLYAEQDTRDEADLGYAALLGFGFGGVAGYLTRNKAHALTETANELNEVIHLDKVAKGEAPDVALSPQGAARLQDLSDPKAAKVVTLEEIEARINAQAADAEDEVLKHIKAKGAEFDAKMAASQAETMDGSVDNLTDWIAELNATNVRQVTPLEEAWLRAKQKKAEKGFLSTAPKTQEELLAATAAKAADAREGAAAKAKSAEEDALWAAKDSADADAAAKGAAAEIEGSTPKTVWDSFANKADDLDNRDDVKEFLDEIEIPPATHGRVGEQTDTVTTFGLEDEAKAPQDAPSSTISDEPNLPPKDDPIVQPEASEAAYKAGDNIVVEVGDEIIGGRIKSFNPETGRMVIIDDATQKPRVVNMDSEDVIKADVADNTDVIEKDGGAGFDPKGSIGAGMPAGEQVAQLTEEAAFLEFKIPFTNIKVPLRFDYYAKFARSENPVMKKMGALLLSNSVGDKNHYARGMNASEIAHLEWNVQKGRYVVANEEAYQAYAKEQGWGWFDSNKPSNRRAFNEAVTSAIRGNSTNQFVDPHVGKVVMAIQKIHSEILEKMKKAGVEGAEEILPDPHYMMRRFNHDKILQLKVKFEPEQLQKVISGALRSVRPLDEAQADKIAAQYYKIVTNIPYADMGRMMMGNAGRSRLRVVAEKIGMDADEIEEVIRLVMNKPDEIAEGSSPRLKHRTLMNENFKTDIVGKDGQTYTVSMSDFFENDAGVLMDLYTRQTGGLIGMAQMGIRSDADWQKLVTEADLAASAGNMNSASYAKQKKHMQDVYNHILGIPMSDEIYGTTERVLKGLRDTNFIRLMGQVGVAQVSELAATLATAGTRAMAMHMPAYKDIIRMGKLGQIDDDLGRDLVNLAGFGAEMRGQQSLGRNIDDVFHDPRMSKVENGLNEGRKAIAMVSGLAPITNIMRQLSARMFSQKMLDYANGFAKLSDSQKKRMAWMGIDDDNVDHLFRDMKKYMKVDDPKTGKLEGIDWEDWEAAQPETYQLFRMAIWRESRRVVQESTIGETAPWMHSQLGKVLTQFRGFMLVAHAKNTLNNIHHRDPEAAMVFMASMMATSLAYVGQTSINYAGNTEKLNEMLAIDNIAAAGFQRSGFSSLIPSVLDTGLGIAGYDPLFKNSRVSSQANSLITGNATYDLAVNKLGGTAKNAIQSVTTDDHQWTEKQVKDAMSSVLPNIFGVRNLINATSAQFPKYNNLRDYNEQ